MSQNPLHLYFHSPCFDGIASAALLMEHLQLTVDEPRATLHAVNYHLRNTWLRTPLHRDAIVVDFLFHPDAKYWFDHHPTTFLSDKAEAVFRSARPLREYSYDSGAASCAQVIWDWELKRKQSTFSGLPELADLVRWANKIDSASYDSVDELQRAKAPALRINAALSIDGTEEFCIQLINRIRTAGLEEAASWTETTRRFKVFISRSEKGLRRLRESARLENGVVVFSVDSRGALVDRYSPYFLFPGARASVGIARTEKGYTLRSMRNPWIDSPHPHLGAVANLFGGGGHKRVGSVVFPEDQKDRAEEAMGAFISAFQSQAH